MKNHLQNKKIGLIYIILLFVVTLILFWKVILHPNYIIWSPHSDLIEQVSYASYFRYKSANEFGQFPLWNPYTFSGYPYVGDFSPHMFYPGRIFHYFFNPYPQFGFIFLFHFFLGGLFMYLFLKTLGLDNFSSFIAGAVYILSARLAYIVWLGHLERETTVMAVPLLFLLVEKYFRKQSKSKDLRGKENPKDFRGFENLLFSKKQNFYLVLIPFVLALQFLGDHPQYSLYTIFVLFIYYIFRAFSERSSEPSLRGFAEPLKISFNNLLKYLSIFAIILILFLLLSSIQFLPLSEKFKFSSRRQGLSYEVATIGSAPPYHFITMLIPDFFGSYHNGSYWGVFAGWKIVSYIGILPLIFVALSFLNRNKFTIFFLFLAAFSLIFALGKYTPLFFLFYNIVPAFNLFRNPVRMIFFFNFAMIVLVGFGTNFFISKLKSISLKRILFVILLVSIASIAITALIYLFASNIMDIGEKILVNKISKASIQLNSLEFYKEKLGLAYNEIASGFLILSIFLLLTALLFYLQSRKPKLKLIKPLIFLIIFFDLGLYSMSFIQVKDPSIVFEKTGIINFLEKDKDIFRVLPFRNYLLPQRSTVRYNIYKVDGYDGMIMKDYYDYISAMNNITVIPANTLPIVDIYYPEMLNLLNAKYVVSERQLSGNYYKNYKLVYNTTSNFYLSLGITYMRDRLINDTAYEFIGKKDVFIYFNKDFLPRAFVVPNAAVLDRNNILAELRNPSFKPKEFVLLEKNPNKPLASKGEYAEQNSDISSSKALEYKEAKITFYSPNKISIEIDIDYSGFLVLSEIWYPGWKALDNGKEIEIYRANYILRSIYLDKGKHKVDFIYDPLSFKIGLWVTIVTLFFIVIYLIRHTGLHRNEN